MKLREIIYLDRTRVDSYISQLAGTLTLQESASTSKTQKGSGAVSVDLIVAKVEGGVGLDD